MLSASVIGSGLLSYTCLGIRTSQLSGNTAVSSAVVLLSLENRPRSNETGPFPCPGILGAMLYVHLSCLVSSFAFFFFFFFFLLSRFNSTVFRGFSRWSHASDLKIGTPVAALPGTLRYRVSAGTGWPGVGIL